MNVWPFTVALDVSPQWFVVCWVGRGVVVVGPEDSCVRKPKKGAAAGPPRRNPPISAQTGAALILISLLCTDIQGKASWYQVVHTGRRNGDWKQDKP